MELCTSPSSVWFRASVNKKSTLNVEFDWCAEVVYCFQTGKINQGNGALKRVVEAIANADSYIPYRDSKLTMLLQV